MQRIVWNFSTNTFEIIAASCEHEGSIMCHEAGIEKTIDYVAAKPNRFLIKLGDNIEAIATNDKRYNQPPKGMKEKENAIPLKQADDVIDRYKRVSNKILAILAGNHERYLSAYGNLAERIATGLDAPYGTETCRIILQYNGEPLFNIFAMHGRKIFNSAAKDFEQRQANMKAAMKLYLQEQEADCAIMLCGHGHKILICEPSKRLILEDSAYGQQQRYLQGITGSGYIQPDQRWYAMCGSARKSRLDGYDDYAQCYPPADLGFVKIIVEDGQIVRLEPFLI